MKEAVSSGNSALSLSRRFNSIGANAVTLHRSQHAAKGASLPEIFRLFKEKVPLTGAKVVAENGAILGHVTEYFIDTASGPITTLAVAPTKPAFLQGVAHLDSSFVRTIGKEIVVVTNEAVKALTPVDGGLKKQAGERWEEMRSKSRRLGRDHWHQNKKPTPGRQERDRQNHSGGNPGLSR